MSKEESKAKDLVKTNLGILREWSIDFEEEGRELVLLLMKKSLLELIEKARAVGREDGLEEAAELVAERGDGSWGPAHYQLMLQWVAQGKSFSGKQVREAILNKASGED